MKNHKNHKEMKTLSAYQREIMQITGCSPEDAEEVEDYLRVVTFRNQQLGSQPCSRFSKASKEAIKEIRKTRTVLQQSAK